MADDRSEEGRVRLTALPHLPLETHSTEHSPRRSPPSDQKREGESSAGAAWGPASPLASIPSAPCSAFQRVRFGVRASEIGGVCTQSWCSVLAERPGVVHRYLSASDATRPAKGRRQQSERGLELPLGWELSAGHGLDRPPWAGDVSVLLGPSSTHAELTSWSHPAMPHLE